MLATKNSEMDPVPDSDPVELDSEEFGVEEGRFVVPDLIGGDTQCWITFSAYHPETNEPCSTRLEDANPSKVPCSADTIDPVPINGHDPDDEHLATFEEAIKAVHRSRQELGEEGLTGVMLAISQLDDLYCVDLDDVVDPDTGVIDSDAEAMLSDANYAELSPSGTGLHILLEDSKGLDPEYTKSSPVEFYKTQAMTYTGRWIRGTNQSINRTDGLVAAWQHAHNDERSSSTSTSSSGSTTSTSSASTSNGSLRLKDCRSPITDRDVELDDLRQALQEIAEFGCRYDEDFKILFEKGRERWHEVVSNTTGGGDSASEAEMSLASKIAWWADEADKFDDEEFDDVELEKLFLASDLGKRSDNQDRQCYSLYNIRKARRNDLE
jgi:primase-polymerase (primpol)-like protein